MFQKHIFSIFIVAAGGIFSTSFADSHILQLPSGNREWSNWQTAPSVCDVGLHHICDNNSGNFWIGMNTWLSKTQREHIDSLGVEISWHSDFEGVAYYQCVVASGLPAFAEWLKTQSNFLNMWTSPAFLDSYPTSIACFSNSFGLT